MGNFTPTLFVVGLLFSAIAIPRPPKPVSRTVAIENLV
jgi:hypothetical protein